MHHERVKTHAYKPKCTASREEEMLGYDTVRVEYNVIVVLHHKSLFHINETLGRFDAG